MTQISGRHPRRLVGGSDALIQLAVFGSPGTIAAGFASASMSRRIFVLRLFASGPWQA